MPYVPPGSNTPQPLPRNARRVTVSTNHRPVIIHHIISSSDKTPTPRSGPSPANATTNTETTGMSPEDIISSQLASTTISSSSTKHAMRSGSDSPPPLSPSEGHPSPTSSMWSLSERDHDEAGFEHIEVVSQSTELDKRDGKGKNGDSVKIRVVSAERAHKPNDQKDPLCLYSEGIYAYTHTLYVKAKHSSAREHQKKDQSHQQFGKKTSGMEKMAQKKALARMING